MFKLSVLSAIVAYVYKTVLSDGILNSWFMFGLKFENRFFYKPIWGCLVCISGQIALWSYLFTMNFNLLELIHTISLTIFITFLINKLINKI